MSEQQLQFDLSSHQPGQYRASIYKNGTLLASTTPGGEEVTKAKRRSLIALLQRSPYSRITWEESPRATGWFGLKRLPEGRSSAVFHAVIERT